MLHRLAMWETRSTTMSNKEVHLLLQTVGGPKTIPEDRLKIKRMRVSMDQLHSYTHDDSQQHKTYLIFLYNNSNRLDHIASSPKSMRKRAQKFKYKSYSRPACTTERKMIEKTTPIKFRSQI